MEKFKQDSLLVTSISSGLGRYSVPEQRHGVFVKQVSSRLSQARFPVSLLRPEPVLSGSDSWVLSTLNLPRFQALFLFGYLCRPIFSLSTLPRSTYLQRGIEREGVVTILVPPTQLGNRFWRASKRKMSRQKTVKDIVLLRFTFGGNSSYKELPRLFK